MNNLNYYIINQAQEIIDFGPELIYTLHHFLSGYQFTKIKIIPANDKIKLSVPIIGALHEDTPPTETVTVYQLKEIIIDEQHFFLVAYQLPLYESEN